MLAFLGLGAETGMQTPFRQNVMKAEDIVFAYERRDLANGKTVGLKYFYYAMNPKGLSTQREETQLH